jgi:CheY-like chemotaxis protein
VGTTFHIYLPRADSAPPPPAETRRGAAPGGTETILVAEDEPDVLALLVGLLQGAGYTVLTALDGAEAIERFRDGRERIELLVLDVVMPKLGGRAAYEQIRRMDGAVPILFSSGHTANVIDAEFIAEHSSRLIRKPYSPDALLRLVRETLDGARGSAA